MHSYGFQRLLVQDTVVWPGHGVAVVFEHM